VGQVGQVIWQTTSAPGKRVTVRREALAVILPVVDIGLAHRGVEALADLEDAIAHLRAALAGGDPDTASGSD
jgi:hypothetical protein